MLILLGVSTIATVFVPTDPPEEGQDPEPVPEPPTRSEPSGELVRERISADDRRPAMISIRVGDQLALTVRSQKPDQVEIPALGELEAVARFAPARFDLLATEEARYAISLVDEDRVIGRIRIRPARNGSSDSERLTVGPGGNPVHRTRAEEDR